MKRKNKTKLHRELLKFANKDLSIGETLFKEILDYFYVTKYIDNYRPDWLKNPSTKKNLEIDRYYPEFKLGFEFNGLHHKVVKQQIYRDKLKKKLCIKRGVILKVVNIQHFRNYEVLCLALDLEPEIFPDHLKDVIRFYRSYILSKEAKWTKELKKKKFQKKGYKKDMVNLKRYNDMQEKEIEFNRMKSLYRSGDKSKNVA